MDDKAPSLVVVGAPTGGALRGTSRAGFRGARVVAERTCELRYCSPWSDLAWQMADGELDRVLVAHEGAGEARPRAVMVFF